ncbi:MAG: phosphotransferase family protein [Desulfococcaceae bacterium]
MTENYLGRLGHEDPLYGYLQYHIAPQAGFFLQDAEYRVFGFSDSSDVYLYEEIHCGFKAVGKFFKSWDREHARQKGETEFRSLLFLRDTGFSSFPHYVVRPYGFNPAIDNLLVTEHLTGETLSRILSDAVNSGGRNRLLRKLAALAHFLAEMHNRTAGEWTVNFDETCNYMEQLLNSLCKRWGLGNREADDFRFIRESWHSRSCMWEDRNVLVHGDATPSNFLFGTGRNVMMIDLERMKWADRVFDLGRLCGELKHFFFRSAGNPLAAEDFIGHFLWEYCCHFPDRHSAFAAINRRVPFYMGITLLRIARNSWIDSDYRRHLIHEAKQILRAKT